MIELKKMLKKLFFVFTLHRSVPFVIKFFTSKEVVTKKKVFFASIIALYAVIPIDLIHDYLPLIGIVDDVTLIAIVLDRMKKHAPSDIQDTIK